MPKYKLKNPKPMGDRDEKYGTTWWSETHDSDKPVMFNLMTGTVGDGAEIEFEESLNKTSAKGTEYLRLRKVKVESAGESAPTSPPNDNTKLLELIYDDTQKILQLVDSGTPKSLAEAWKETNKKDVVVEDVSDEAINLDSIPF